MTDEKLAECSASATGVYIRIMCLMHKSDPYGTILLKQKYKVTESQIKNFSLQLSKHFPYDPETILSGLTELVNENVVEIQDDKLFQKRMVRDGEISEKRSFAGQRGGKSTQDFIYNYDKAKSEAPTEYENESKDENINVSFEDFWNLYNKKQGSRINCEKKWMELKPEERDLIMDYIPKWIPTISEKQYQPYPETFLNQRRWENELPVITNEPGFDEIKDFWKIEFHPMFVYSEESDRSINSLIGKISTILRETIPDPPVDKIVETFKAMCLKLPEWFKDKDLQIIDLKFNEIIQQIKNGTGTKPIANQTAEERQQAIRDEISKRYPNG